ncbi:MAG: multidrug efflux RND transporter permease subunit [Candidatus Accumulibacter sp.]|jgi:multidrug efflux pump|nr:multidrug efflux RND transporter permease subunit [Accumulibacter sp.]
MHFSAIFIRRPVATSLLTAAIALLGILAFDFLPVASLPQVDYPTISVSAALPGASPETMASTVATPLERSLGTIAGITEITSNSSLGSTNIVMQFDLDRDINGAARDVQAALNAARSLLPTGLPSNPTYRKVNPADFPIMILAMTSDSMTRGQMYDVASTILAQKMLQLKGVGQVTVGGSSLPAVRVELNPGALSRAGIGFEDVREAIVSANVNRPKGYLESDTRTWQIQANDQATRAEDYVPMIIAWKNGAPVRLSDVASVEDSVQDIRNAGLHNGKPTIMLMVNREPGANTIETIERIKEVLPQLRASIPADIDIAVTMDATPSIRASLREVEHSLAISVVLVVLVVFLFLGGGRAILVPIVAVPVSLIGAFGVMYLAGFGLNNLSLMALTIATGFVVDDAVVVMENISRHVEAGMKPFDAAIRGAREVSFTVLSMTLSLIAVFLPILLMGGIVGRLFREFAVTLSVSILISLVVSLTTTPMMCAYLLGHRRVAEKGIQAFCTRFFDRMLDGYRRSLDWALVHRPLMMFVLFATIGFNIYLYSAIPKGFFPQQDSGRIYGTIQTDQSASFQFDTDMLAVFIDKLNEDPDIVDVVGFNGGGRSVVIVTLKHLSEREASVDQVIDRLRAKFGNEPGAILYMQPIQEFRIGGSGRSATAAYQFTLQADSVEELRRWEPSVRRAMGRVKEIVDVNTDRLDRGLQISLAVDRDAVSRLGINQRLINATLGDFFGQRQISTIYHPLNQYRVVMEAAPEYLQSPDSLKDVFVIGQGADGKPTQIPLTAFTRWESTTAPLSVRHQGQFAASTIAFNLSPGVSLSQATEGINAEVAKIGLPSTVQGSFQGTARLFQASIANQALLILAALLAVYIVLGILYESLIHPVTILSTLPSAGVGAILALLLFRMDFNVIAMIGVILLIGIVKKNAIMMIDFALEVQRRDAREPVEAIREACLLRFRPIMMTTMAALFGALPLVFGRGDGAELRQPLGISIVGGLVLSQLLTLYTTPIVYLYLDRLRFWREGLRACFDALSTLVRGKNKLPEAYR